MMKNKFYLLEEKYTVPSIHVVEIEIEQHILDDASGNLDGLDMNGENW